MAIKLIQGHAVGAVKIGLSEGKISRFTGSELYIGVGDQKALTRRKMVILLRSIVAQARQYRLNALQLEWAEIRRIADKKIADSELATIAGTAFEMANYEYVVYKTPSKEGYLGVSEIALLGTTAAVFKALERGKTIGEAVNACRDLSNTPGKDLTPELLAEATANAARGTAAKVKVLGRADMERLGMGAILGVAQGSVQEPQFIVVEYWGTDRTKKPIVLIGKGVTFDTGGLNIKTGDHMYEMHMDMSGGAAVIQATIVAAALGVKKNVIALVPAVENSPSGSSVRPGDILKSLSGKTIEILNTDAEGRVVLADAITYAKRYNPAAVIDVATLTGAALTALGTVASAVMTNNEQKIPEIMDLAERSGDYLWPLPLWDEYNDMVKGTFGDVPNISTMGNSRNGGVIAGGKFLEVFAKELDCLWLHLDIAPRMTADPAESLSKGAAGAPVRFLLEFIEHAKVK